MARFEITSPDGKRFEITAPEGATQEQALTYAKNQFNSKPQEEEGEFSKGLDRSLAETKAIVTEGIPALAGSLSNKVLGTDFDVQENVDAYVAQTEKANKENPAKVPSYTDVNSLSDTGDYIAAGAGEILPSVATSILSAGIGGTIAKSLVKQGIKEFTEAEMTKAIGKGILIGGGMSSFAQEAPSTYLQEAMQGHDAPFTALAAGAVKASIEQFTEFGIMQKVLGPGASELLTSAYLKKLGVPDVVNKVFTQAVKSAPKEGLEEVAQSSVDILADALVANNPMFTPENFNNLVDSGLKGMIGGAAMGGAVAPLMKGKDEGSEGYKKNPKNDKRFELDDAGSAPKGIKIDPKLMASGVIEPLTLPPDLLNSLKESGIDAESLVGYDQQQTETLNQFIKVPDPVAPMSPQQQTMIMERAKKIKTGKRTDPTFVAGDGEVVVGAKTPFGAPYKEPIVDPITEVRIADYQSLQQKAADVVEPPVKLSFTEVKKDEPMFQRSNKPQFLNMYSKMEKEIEKSFPNKATPEEFLSLMEKGATAGKYKQDEVNYSGISTYLKDFVAGKRQGLTLDKDGKVTKKDILDASKNFLSGYFDGANDVNTLAVQARDLDDQHKNVTLEKEKTKNYRVRVLNFEPGANPSLRTHWGKVANVVVHHRSSDITTDDGTDLKLVQEIQGDIQQRIEDQKQDDINDVAQGLIREENQRLWSVISSTKYGTPEKVEATKAQEQFYLEEVSTFLRNKAKKTYTPFQKSIVDKVKKLYPVDYGYYTHEAESRSAELEEELADVNKRIKDLTVKREALHSKYGDPVGISALLKQIKESVEVFGSPDYPDELDSDEAVDFDNAYSEYRGILRDMASNSVNFNVALKLRIKKNEDSIREYPNLSNSNKRKLKSLKLIDQFQKFFDKYHRYAEALKRAEQSLEDVEPRLTALKNKAHSIEKDKRKLDPKNLGPSIPYKTDYPMLALKDALMLAVEEGQTAIAIPMGPMVKDIQGHSDEKAGPFYEKRVLNNLKELAKFLKSEVVQKTYTPGGKAAPKHKTEIQQRLDFLQHVYRKMDERVTELKRGTKTVEGYQYNKEKAAEDIIAKWKTWDVSDFDLVAPIVASYSNSQNDVNASQTATGVVAFDIMLTEAKNQPPIVQAMLGDAAEIIANDGWASYFPTTETQYAQYLTGSSSKSYTVNVLQLSPEGVRIVKEEGLPMMQRGAPINLPASGQLDIDYALPVKIAKNWYGTQLSPQAREEWGSFMEMLKRITRETLGPNVKFQFMDNMFTVDDMHQYPVEGTWFANTLYLSLNENTTEASILEALYHEFWHGLERMKAFSKGEVKFMDGQTKLLRHYYDKDGYLTEFDFNDLMKDPLMREELRANAFGKAMLELIKDDQALQKVPAPFRGVFRKAMNFLKRLRMGVSAQGYKQFSDILTKTLEGGYATEQQMRDTLMDSVDKTAQIRFQKKAKKARAAHRQESENLLDKRLQGSKADTNDMTAAKGSTMGYFAQKLQSIGHLEHKYPMAGQVVNAVRRKFDMSNKMLNTYADAMGKFSSLPKDIRFRLSELADEMRSTDQKATLDNQGRLTFQRDGRIMKLKDVELSKTYIDLQSAFARVLNDHAEHALLKLQKVAFNTTNEIYTIQDLERMRPDFDPKKEKTELAALDDMLEIMKSVERMQKSDFFPAMRFGNYGISVIDITGLSADDIARVKRGETKLGKQAAFYTLESGEFNKLYNKHQLEDISKDLKAKYNDSNYVVLGDRHHTNFDVENLSPFTMTHALEKQLLDPRFFNLELLSSLLQNEGLSPKAKDKLTEKLYGDVSVKGFAKKFEKSRHLPGYSKDYDRAVHSYFSGAAHYIAGLNSAEEFSAIGNVVNGLSDEKLKKSLLDFLKYTNSAAEDMAALRTVNFLWTMGGNLSTALLQAVTLPTFTLSNMTKYNPSVLDNARLIAKWTGIAIKLVSRGSLFNPLGDTFGSPLQIEKAWKDKIINYDEMHFLLKNYWYGHLKAMSTEEQIGYKNYDVRGMGGGVKHGLSATATFLGKPIAFMEQVTRFATVMAAYEISRKPGVMDRAKRVLKEDYKFKTMVENSPDMNEQENLALYIMDEAHGVFGKLGRPEMLKGFMGAVPLAFMTYPYQMIEGLIRNLGQGAEGRKAMVVTFSAMFLLGGLMGLPGAELLKEVLEALEMKVTGIERDYKLMLMETIAEKTGSVKAAKFLTSGSPRAFLGLSTELRTGLPIPGQEVLFTLLGIRKDPVAMLGVQGSILTGIADAMLQYNTGAPVATIAGAMAPTALANVFKAYQYSQEGVRSSKQQLVTKKDTTAGTVIAKAFGFTSDQVASGRETAYNEMLQSSRGKTGIDRIRTKGKKAAMGMIQAQEEGDDAAYKEHYDKLEPVISEYVDFCVKNELPVDVPSFMKSLMTSGIQSVTGQTSYKDLSKASRIPVEHWRALGLSPARQ